MKQAQPEPGASSLLDRLLTKAARRVLSKIQRAALEVSVRVSAALE